MKGLCYAEGSDPWGHSVQKLVTVCASLSTRTDLDAWRRKAAALDRFHIAARYPNGLPDLTPEQNYFREDAETAIAHAEWILTRCREVFETRPSEREPQRRDGGDAREHRPPLE